MNPASPLESIYFIKLPEDFALSSTIIKLDTSIPLPVQKKDKDEANTFNIQELTQEQILSGILTILAYDVHNEHIAYYRDILKQARPNIKKELSEAAILKAKNEDYEIAEEIFLALRGFDPEDLRIVLNTALFFDERANSYRRSGLNEDADAYDNDALAYYKMAMEAEPVIEDAFFNAGFFYLKQNNYIEAKSCFETYLALTCDVADDVLGESGIYKKERAQEIVNNINNQNIDDVHFKAAYDLISSGQEEKGLEEIRKFISKNQKVWNAWFMLGWGLRRLCRYEDAKQAFLESLECYGGSSNCDTFNELAICLMELGQLDEAKKCLLKALSLEPENTKIISNLGFLYLKQNNISEAQKYFQVVLEIDPKDKIALEQLEKLESM